MSTSINGPTGQAAYQSRATQRASSTQKASGAQPAAAPQRATPPADAAPARAASSAQAASPASDLSASERRMISQQFPPAPDLSMRLYGPGRNAQTVRPDAVGSRLDVQG